MPVILQPTAENIAQCAERLRRVPGVRLTRFHADNGVETPGTYPGLDRFGRVARQMWVDDGFAENLSLIHI